MKRSLRTPDLGWRANQFLLFNWKDVTGEGNLICVKVPLHRLELCSSAPEADALSTELQGRATRFYHRTIASR
jgi:hypothetical protein